MLFPVSLPSRGGDTQYVNMHEAYDDLPAATKERIDGLKAVHVYLSKYSPRALRPLSEDSARQVPPPGIHPLVRTHPENGRKALLSEPGTDRGDRRHGGRGSARPRRRADDARDPEKIRIPPPMALRRLCDLGQPQRHPQGQPRLRHERAALPLPPDAEGRDAGLIEGSGHRLAGRGKGFKPSAIE